MGRYLTIRLVVPIPEPDVGEVRVRAERES